MRFYVRFVGSDQTAPFHVVDSFGNTVGRFRLKRLAWDFRNAKMGVVDSRAVRKMRLLAPE
jgi:hypothetical protein